jgi:hypothetical protein
MKKMDITMLQPWSTPVLKTKLPLEVLQTMTEISDKVLADKNAVDWGANLAGQICSEPLIDHDILDDKTMDYFKGMVREFVIRCKCQMLPPLEDKIRQEKWLVRMVRLWIISQKPNEYNPVHFHKNCSISTVMYLKIPKMLPSRKKHRSDDGAILFLGNSSRDLELSAPSVAIPSQVGDFYIFGANQQHAVYPYRCEEGQKDVERRSISFNAVFQKGQGK